MFKIKANSKFSINASTKTKDPLRRVLMKCMFKMEELALAKAPFDTGELREKISLFPQVLSDRYVLASRAKHSREMEYGTVPFFAPIDPLKAWAKRKLGDENIAYAVRNKIAKVGIKAHPFMRPAIYDVKNFWLQKFLRDEKIKK